MKNPCGSLKNILVLTFLLVLAGCGQLSNEATKSASCDLDSSGYCLKSNASDSYMPNLPYSYSFSIADDRGKAVTNFEIAHEKIMHVIVVRKDLEEFQHVHPDYDEETGLFTLSTLTFPSEGEYRLFADFKPSATMSTTTLYEDFLVGEGGMLWVGHPDETRTDSTYSIEQRYTVDLSVAALPTALRESALSFHLSKDGTAVHDLENYLGARGHLVILRYDHLDFVHTHPMEASDENLPGQVNFKVTFPESGVYKMFLQFQHNGEVFTTEFVIKVAESNSVVTESETMDNGMH